MYVLPVSFWLFSRFFSFLQSKSMFERSIENSGFGKWKCSEMMLMQMVVGLFVALWWTCDLSVVSLCLFLLPAGRGSIRPCDKLRSKWRCILDLDGLTHGRFVIFLYVNCLQKWAQHFNIVSLKDLNWKSWTEWIEWQTFCNKWIKIKCNYHFPHYCFTFNCTGKWLPYLAGMNEMACCFNNGVTERVKLLAALFNCIETSGCCASPQPVGTHPGLIASSG